jgi:septum formation protein
VNIILASTSPRRRELLALLGLSFDIIPPTCDEILTSHFTPSEQAKQFAMDKAWSIAANHPHDLILGSDTVIEIDGTLLGKPKDLKEAEIMLRQLRGRCHQVHTGIALIHKARDFSLALVETAMVWIKDFDEEELSKYLNTGESLGKAGAYSIQGEGARLIEKIEGDYPIIVGLPLWHTAKLLEKQGVVLPISVEEVYQIKPYNNWKDFS